MKKLTNPMRALAFILALIFIVSITPIVATAAMPKPAQTNGGIGATAGVLNAAAKLYNATVLHANGLTTPVDPVFRTTPESCGATNRLYDQLVYNDNGTIRYEAAVYGGLD